MPKDDVKLTRVKDGWSAHGDGWAVHAPTKEKAKAKYEERLRFYESLKNKPLWFENPENPFLKLANG